MAEQDLTKLNSTHRLRRANLYQEFVLWASMPDIEQQKLGIESQKAFSEYYGISEQSLVAWKKRPDFEDRRDKILNAWAMDKTANVAFGIYRSAVKGNPGSQRLWLEYFKKFNPKQEIEHTIKVVMAPNDLRFIVQGMPESYKEKFYGYIREIIDTALSLRNAGQLQDGDAPSADVEATVLEQADHDAQELPSDRANVLAQGDQTGVCEYLGDYANGATPTSSHHNQSTARRW